MSLFRVSNSDCFPMESQRIDRGNRHYNHHSRKSEVTLAYLPFPDTLNHRLKNPVKKFAESHLAGTPSLLVR